MFKGSMVALVTPFKNGEVDWKTLDGLVDFHVEAGSDALVPCGTTGESPTLDAEETIGVIRAVIEQARGMGFKGGFVVIDQAKPDYIAKVIKDMKMLEGMSVEDHGNVQLRIYTAQGFYGYSYRFVEQTSPERAVAVYTRCLEHATAALASQGFEPDPERAPLADLEQALKS